MSGFMNNSTYCTARLVVANEYGLHIRAAIMLAKLAEAIPAQLTIVCGRHRVSGESVMGLVALGAARGTALQAIAEGVEAGRMIRAVRALFNARFYEGRPPRRKMPAGRRRTAPPAQDHTLDMVVVQRILERVAAPPVPALT